MFYMWRKNLTCARMQEQAVQDDVGGGGLWIEEKKEIKRPKKSGEEDRNKDI